MLTKNIENRNQVEFVSLEEMVPADHLLRQIDAAIDFNKIYEFVGDLYCKDNGRPSIDPVVLFKIVLIQHIYGIQSLRRTDEINKDREAHGKKPFDDDNTGNTDGGKPDEPETVEKTVSTTDPECGVFHKGEHKKVFAYKTPLDLQKNL